MAQSRAALPHTLSIRTPGAVEALPRPLANPPENGPFRRPTEGFRVQPSPFMQLLEMHYPRKRVNRAMDETKPPLCQDRSIKEKPWNSKKDTALDIIDSFSVHI